MEVVRVAGVITALKMQKKQARRVNVYLDHTYAFSLDLTLAAGLHKGQSLTDEQITNLSEQDDEQRAYLRAVQYLSRRPHAEEEIRQKLIRKGFEEPALTRVLARLNEAGLLDDAAFARTWVENRLTYRPRGASALRVELKRKGVPGAAIDAALESFEEDLAARRAAQKAMRRYAGLEPGVARRRLMGYLSRRGFGYSVVKEVVGQLLPGWNHSDAESEVSR